MDAIRHRLLICLFMLLIIVPKSRAVIIRFEDLPSPPATNASTGMLEANGSLNYGGVLWDSRITITGINYAVAGPESGPYFSAGAPDGGDYYITNNTDTTEDPATTDGNGITLTTTMVLRGAYFGAVELYGYYPGEGAVQVTIHAMNGDTVLDSLTFDLTLNEQTGGPENTPVAMTYFDTSAFEALTGITGYVIDRTANPAVEPNVGFTGWAADNFDFVDIPEPVTTGWVVGSALGLLAMLRKTSRKRPDSTPSQP